MMFVLCCDGDGWNVRILTYVVGGGFFLRKEKTLSHRIGQCAMVYDF